MFGLTPKRKAVPIQDVPKKRKKQEKVIKPHEDDSLQLLFGKHRGKTFLTVFTTERRYANWVMRQSATSAGRSQSHAFKCFADYVRSQYENNSHLRKPAPSKRDHDEDDFLGTMLNGLGHNQMLRAVKMMTQAGLLAGSDYDSDEDCYDERRDPSIVLAAKRGDLPAVRRELEAAAREGNPWVINSAGMWTEYKGADWGRPKGGKAWEWHKDTALIAAARGGHLHVVKHLLEHHADPTLRSSISYADDHDTATSVAEKEMSRCTCTHVKRRYRWSGSHP